VAHLKSRSCHQSEALYKAGLFIIWGDFAGKYLINAWLI